MSRVVIELDDEQLDRLADRLAPRVADRLIGLVPVRAELPARAEVLVDASEIARRYGRTRSWAYQHATELGAVHLGPTGKGKRPRLAFSPTTVAATFMVGTEAVEEGPPAAPATPRRRPPPDRTRSGAPLLPVRPRGA